MKQFVNGIGKIIMLPIQLVLVITVTILKGIYKFTKPALSFIDKLFKPIYLWINTKIRPLYMAVFNAVKPIGLKIAFASKKGFLFVLNVLKAIDRVIKPIYTVLYKYLVIISGYVWKGFLIITYPLVQVYLVLTKMPVFMKVALSALIWGSGQFFNKQFIKATMFFTVFALIIFTELYTGSYFDEFNLYEDKLAGEEIEEEVTSYLPTFYYYQQVDIYAALRGQTAEDISESEIIDEGLFISFDFLHYAAEINNMTFDEATFIFYDDQGRDYLVEDVPFTNDDFYKFIADELHRINDELTLNGIIQTIDTETRAQAEEIINTRTQEEIDDKAIQELRTWSNYQEVLPPAMDQAAEELMALEDEPVLPTDPDFESKRDQYITDNYVSVLKRAELTLASEIRERIVTENGDVIYNQFYKTSFENNYNLIYKRLYSDEVLKYEGIRAVRTMIESRMSSGLLGMDNDDYNEMMIRIYYEMNPEEFEAITNKLNNYFYERTGFFVKGIWGLVTLGETQALTVNEHVTMAFFDTSYASVDFFTLEVQISGHHSTNLMLSGIIALLIIVYLVVIYSWNIKDALASSRQFRDEGKAQNEKEYYANLYEDFFEYIVLTPALLLVTFISVMPIIFGLFVAFTNYNNNHIPPGKLVDWVGLNNFIQVFSLSESNGIDFGGQFWRVASWTLIWAFAATFTCFFGGFIQAVIINNKRVVFRKFWRSVLILPWAVPALISQMIFRVIFNDLGYVNQILAKAGVTELFIRWGAIRPYEEAGSGLQRLFYFGEDTFQWLSNEANPWFVRIFIIVLNVWLGFPFFMALMSGVMTSIDKSLYEAASIDGATGFQQFRFITMPLVLFATSPLLVMTFSGNFNNFGVIYFITGGGPGGGGVETAYAGSTDILISWIYKLTTDDNIRWYSMASVFSILIFLIIGTLSAWNFTRTRAFREGD